MAAWMRRTTQRRGRSATSSSSNPGTASRRPRRPTSGWRSMPSTSTCRCGSGRAGPSGWSSTRCAATATTSAWASRSGSRSTPFTIAATPYSSRSIRSAAEPTRRAPTSGNTTRTGTWCGIWRSGSSMAAGRWKRPFPFKSLRYGPGAQQTWGFQARRNSKWKNEISFLTHVPASFGLSRGSHSASIYPETRRPRSAAGVEEHRDQAVCDRRPDDRSHRRAGDRERPGRRRRARRQDRRDPGADRGPDLQHRLRAGRSGRAASQPHALQPVLSGEARVLHREPGHVHVRRRRRRVGRGQRRRRRNAVALLQPPDRARERQGSADPRRGPAHRAHRRHVDRRDRHADAG